jgi:hypothetical protein
MATTPQPRISDKHSIRVQGSSPDFDSKTLEEITRSAQHATGASGAALVLSDGNIMSCRACSGELGPPVGTRLNTNTGFTATCVQAARIVRCDDTETDPRVDGSTCVELGIRSILAVPVFNNQNVAGVLEVLSNQTKKFTDRHATALQLLARLVETVVYGSRAEVSREPATPDAKPQRNNTVKVNTDQAMLTCLSCGHGNPQESQFCNQCGVILFRSDGFQTTTVDFTRPEGSERVDESLKEICKIISGDTGTATWSEISERLLADQRGVAARDNANTVATEETAKKRMAEAKSENAVPRLAATQGSNGIKARLGVVRRNLWL